MQKSFLKTMAIGCLIALSTAAQAVVPNYDNLYIFGDSYCDVGNIFAATGGAEPAAPYFDGRFSNGPIWLDHVAGFLHLQLQPSLLGGTDYAFGGAWVTAPQSIPGGTIPSVPQKVELYLVQHDGRADPRALYILEGGGNDVLGTTSGTPQAGYRIATGIAQSELKLRQSGAKHFVIPNLFNVGLLPAAAGNVAFASAASVWTNKYLDQFLEREGLLDGIRILRIDSFSLLSSVQTDPTHFGFADIVNPCISTTICADPDHTFFWDVYHPTLFGHAFFAVTLENVLATER